MTIRPAARLCLPTNYALSYRAKLLEAGPSTISLRVSPTKLPVESILPGSRRHAAPASIELDTPVRLTAGPNPQAALSCQTLQDLRSQHDSLTPTSDRGSHPPSRLEVIADLQHSITSKRVIVRSHANYLRPLEMTFQPAGFDDLTSCRLVIPACATRLLHLPGQW